MLPRITRLLGPALIGIGLVAAPIPARAQQQQPTERESWTLPGWTFTPGVVFGLMRDSNVTLLATQPGQEPARDTLFEFQPFGQIQYLSPRTSMNGGYRGMFRRYAQLDELNTVDTRFFMSLRNRISRRVTLFVNENFAQVPSTDRLELYGVPFLRSGGRYNDASASVEARLTRTTDLTTRYELTWVDFIEKKSDVALTGGRVQGIRSSLSHRFNERTSFGGEYGARWADLNAGERSQFYQDVGAVVRYRVLDNTSVEAAAGMAHLTDRSRDITRTGPYVRFEATQRLQRATIGGSFGRNFVPSVAFGGANQSETLHGYVQMPLNHNRIYVQESFTWHRNHPLDPAFVPLRSTWLNTVVGYSIQRWFRIEGYHELRHQDTRLAGGRINRQVLGVQFVVSEPMRIR